LRMGREIEGDVGGGRVMRYRFGGWRWWGSLNRGREKGGRKGWGRRVVSFVLTLDGV